MIVKTKNPIRIITNSKDNYSNIDAKNKDEVKAFQRYAVSRGANLDFTNSDGKEFTGEDAIDGDYKKKTKAAYKIYGDDWEKTRPKKDEPKQEPKKDEPKKDEPKKDETKKDERKKDETKKDEVTVTKDDKGNTITVTKKADGTTLTVVTDKNGKEISKKESGMSKNLKIGLMIGGGVLVLLIMAVIIKQSQK